MPARLMVSTMGMETRRWSQSAVLSPVQMGPTCREAHHTLLRCLDPVLD